MFIITSYRYHCNLLLFFGVDDPLLYKNNIFSRIFKVWFHKVHVSLNRKPYQHTHFYARAHLFVFDSKCGKILVSAVNTSVQIFGLTQSAI